MALTASVASADTWTTQLGVFDHPEAWVDVLTTATDMGGYWNWTYALTPGGTATNIRGLTITLGAIDTALVTNITGPFGWDGGTPSGSAVYWQVTGNDPDTLDAGETFTFGFDSPRGPSSIREASLQDTYGYTGPVRGPAPAPVPEPMSVLLGIMGLSSVVGFSRLRRK